MGKNMTVSVPFYIPMVHEVHTDFVGRRTLVSGIGIPCLLITGNWETVYISKEYLIDEYYLKNPKDIEKLNELYIEKRLLQLFKEHTVHDPNDWGKQIDVLAIGIYPKPTGTLIP